MNSKFIFRKAENYIYYYKNLKIKHNTKHTTL